MLNEPSAAWLGRPLSEAEKEVSRVMQICNSCRYCEGYCGVFPAMTRRIGFDVRADIHYLANLCHSCGACLHACQYAPPHEFAVNVPRSLATVRGQTYRDYAWPSVLGRLYESSGPTLAVAAAASLTLFLLLALAMTGSLFQTPARGNFYAVFPHRTLVLLFGSVFTYSSVALAIGVGRFWRDVRPGTSMRGAATEAVGHALTLKYLDGGHGEGCNDEDDRFTLRRRRFHHLTFYGFALCVASTAVATLYHYVLGLSAPYALTSLPVILGTVGGAGLLAGPAGLMWLNLRRNAAHGDPAQRTMDRAFILLLFAASLTGLALMAGRETAGMALLLAIHLGIVMALFLTLPYGKFAHGFYRLASLLKSSIERRMPSAIKLGSE